MNKLQLFKNKMWKHALLAAAVVTVSTNASTAIQDRSRMDRAFSTDRSRLDDGAQWTAAPTQADPEAESSLLDTIAIGVDVSARPHANQ